MLPLSAPGSTSASHPKTPRDPQLVAKTLSQPSPAVGKGPLSLLKCPEEGAGREEGAAHSLKGKGSWARVKKLSKHKEHPPPNTGTHRDSDRGDRDSPPRYRRAW